MYWTANDINERAMDVSIDADSDEYVFLYLTIKDEDGREYADVIIQTPADVDEFEREVTKACARFRSLCMSQASAEAGTKKSG